MSSSAIEQIPAMTGHAAASSGAGKPARVLIADSAPGMREQIIAALETTGIPTQVVQVENGQDALRALQSGQIDLAYVDVVLPGISGMDVIGEARRNNHIAHTVLISATVLPNWAVIATDLFAYEFLKKPFDQADIANALIAYQKTTEPTHILILDSSGQARNIMRKTISSSRFRTEIDETDNGGHALKLARLKKFDIVLVDLGLSGMSGLEAACQLQAIDANINVIVMMAGNDIGLTNALKHFGLKSVLKKPFYPRDIDMLMHAVFKLRRPYLMNATTPADKRAFSVAA
jgi:DNA-binding NtrC family response regulator